MLHMEAEHMGRIFTLIVVMAMVLAVMVSFARTRAATSPVAAPLHALGCRPACMTDF